MGKYSRLGKNTLFVFVGNVGGKALAILMLPFFTRWLSVADFGVTDMIMTYATLLFFAASFCICESAFIFPKDQPKQVQSEYFTSGLVCSLLNFLLFASVLAIIDIWIPVSSDNVLVKYRWYIFFIIFAMYVENYFQQFTRSINQIKTYSFAGIVQSVCIIVFSFVFIPTYGVWGYVMTWAYAYTLTGIYSFLISGSYKYISLSSISKHRYVEMLKYSLPLIPNGMMFWMMNSMNRPIMEQYLGADAVGLYALANKFPIILTTLFNIFLLSWQISVLEEYRNKDFGKYFNRILQIVILFIGIIFIAISLLNKMIVTMTATPDYYEAWRYIALLTLGSLIFALSAFVGAIFLATKESKYFLYSSFGGAIVALMCNFILIPWIGIYGAAISIIMASLTMLVLRVYFCSKHVVFENIAKNSLTLLLFLAISFSVLIPSFICMYLAIIIEIIAVACLNKNAINDYHHLIELVKKKRL